MNERGNIFLFFIFFYFTLITVLKYYFGGFVLYSSTVYSVNWLLVLLLDYISEGKTFVCLSDKTFDKDEDSIR